MDISGPSPVGGPSGIQGTRGVRPLPANLPVPAAGADRVEISSVARFLGAGALRNVPEIRTDRVNEIRRQIEAGTYETEEKIRTAVERFLEEIRGT